MRLVLTAVLAALVSCSLASLPEYPLRPRDAKPFLLRVMPLGASITLGYRSTDKNGYREALRQQLRYAGWEVDNVGRLHNGTMKNNAHEGHFGFRIEQVSKAVEQSLWYQPNVVLIEVGTNDAVQNYHVSSAGQRIDSLLTELFDAINGTTVILATLVPNTRQPKRVDKINAQYRNVAAYRRALGYRVVLAEMAYFITPDQLADGTHPTDHGYEEMASVWWAAIQEAENEGMIQPPNDIGQVGVMTKTEEQDLDDGTGNPDLPSYSAPAQPTLSGGDSRLEIPGLSLLMTCQLVSVISLVLASS